MPVDTGDIVITKISEEPGAANLKVEVPSERVKAAEDRAASTYAKRARLPGFRKGKAPLAVVRRQFRDEIRETVIRELVGESWKAAVQREGLKPIADPRVRGLKFEAGTPMSFELLVELKPEIALDRLGGFRLTRRVPRVTDEMVDRQLDELRHQKAPWAPVEGERPGAGDLVSVSIATAETGSDAPEGAEAAWGEPRQYQVVLGRGQAIPDLEAAIMGLVPGETAEAPVRYPDDFADEAKRGETRRVRVVLHEVKREELPPLTDDFARELGDFESVDELRRAVRQDLEADAAREADAELRRRLIDELVAANNLQAPRPMVQRLLSLYAQAYEVADERLDAFAAEFGPVAEQQVKRDLVLDYVAERHGLAATEDDVRARIRELAERRGADPRQVRAGLEKAGRLRELERGVTEEKVFAFLLEQSTIEDA